MLFVTVCFSDSQLNLLSSSNEVQNFLGEGSFGKVVKCVHTVSNTEVPIKKNWRQARDLKPRDFVRWNRSFFHEGFICLEFELLDLSLKE